MSLIDFYTPKQLAAVSAVLCRVTIVRSWTNLGKEEGGVTQEEVQCLRIGPRLLIGCNHNGADAVKNLFTKYSMDAGAFDKAMRSFYYLIVNSHELKKTHKVPSNLSFSTQEADSIKLAPFDTFHVADFVKDRLTLKSASEPKKSSARSDSFRNLAGEKFTAKLAGNQAPPTCRYNQLPIGNGIYIVDETTHDAHAEMKTLRVLLGLLAEGTITTATKVQLGGLKGACQKCDQVISGFNAICDNMIEIPANDTRSSADPGHWALPDLTSLSNKDFSNTSGLSIRQNLLGTWTNTWMKY